MLTKIILLSLCTVFTVCSGLEELPEFLHVCNKNDPKLMNCMIKSIYYLKPYLKNGIPNMDIPSVEPLELEDLLVSERTRQSNGISVSVKHVRAYGSSDFEIKKIDVIKYGEKYHIDIFIPQIDVNGIYNINGQILLLPIKGAGKFSGNFSNCGADVNILFDNRNNFVTMKKLDVKVKVGKGNVKLQNLFNGDKLLGDAINDVINQNFELLSKDIIPLIDRALQRIFKKIGNKITSRYTVEQLFPVS